MNKVIGRIVVCLVIAVAAGVCAAYTVFMHKEVPVGTWSKLKIVDAHAHIGSFRGYDLSTPTLLNNIETYGIRRALISNIDGSNLTGTTENLNETEANNVTVEVVKEHPEIFRGLLWARPIDGDEALLEPFLKGCVDRNGKRIFVGLKFHPEFNQVPADDERLNPYLKICERNHLPAAFHSGSAGSNSDPERIYNLARRHPKVPIILYHMGFGTDHIRSIQVAKEAKEKGDALLFLETAQVDPESVLKAVNEVDSKYVMFGTDATYFGKEHYRQYQSQIDILKKHLDRKDLENVLHKNAERIFRI